MRLREALANVVRRFDSWQNPLTGFGTLRDKTVYSEFLPFRTLSDQQLSSLYHGDDMAARMVDVVPQEMLRESFVVETGDPKLDDLVREKFDTLGAREKLLDAITWGRLYGGSAIVLGADDGRPAATPLAPEHVRSLDWLYVIDRRFLFPLTYYEQLGDPKYGEPEIYTISATGARTGVGFTVHESRLVLFRGARTGIRERAERSSWDHSVLQRPYEILRQFNTGWKAVEVLLTDGNQAVLKMSGLADMIASGERSSLEARLEILDMYRSVLRALVIDADGGEGFERQGVSFSDIPGVLDKYMLRLAAAVQMPVTILMGQSPAGMNATGESDFRWFYDRIRSEQTNYLAPRIRRIVDVLVASREVQGKPGGGVVIKFPSLWSETPSAEATRRKTIAEADAVYVNAGVVLPEEIALARLRPEGFESEITLSEESVRARESVLKDELAKLESGQPEPREGEEPPSDGREAPPVDGEPPEAAQ
jgi:phage-related protein (TIGR01555 family)